MLKYVAPLERRLRHIQRPAAFRTSHHAAEDDGSDLTSGQRLAERAAAAIGSWRFLMIQAAFLIAWVIVNALRWAGFDPPPFILLNLLLSFQAAFTGPVLLIAANVGAARDHAGAARMERLEETVLARLDRLEQRMAPPAELAPRKPATPEKKTATATTKAARKA